MGKDKKKSPCRYLAAACFCGLTIWIPLYYRDAYFDIISAKGKMLCILLLTTAGLYFVMAAVSYVQKRKSGSGGGTGSLQKLCPTDIAVLFFAVAVFIAWFHAGDKKAAFLGNEGWWIGAGTLVGVAVCYFLLSRHLSASPNLWLPVWAVNLILFGMAVLHSAGPDVLSLHREIAEYQRFQYLSTIGQINGMMGYLALIFPVFAVFFIISRDRVSAVLYGILLVLGELNLLLCASDGIWPAGGICLFFLLPFVWREKRRMLRFWGMTMVFGLCILFLRLCPWFKEKLADMDGMAAGMMGLPAGIAICLLSAMGMGLTLLLCEKKENVWKALLYVVESLLTGAAGFLMYYNVEAFRWHGGYWGSGRKYLWTYEWNLFLKFPLHKKLFGVGPELLAGYLEECREYFGQTVLTAHSEFLQYLLTLGIIGAVAWLVLIVSIVYAYFRYRVYETVGMAWFLSLFAYFVQAAVISPQPVTMAIFCVMLSCYGRSILTQKNRQI